MNSYESLKFCDGAQNKKDVPNWTTLHEFDNSIKSKSLDARVYKQNNSIVLAFSGANLGQIKDDSDALKILYSNNIPKQYLDAENLYKLVKYKYPKAVIEFTGYSLGGTYSNLLSHHTGLPSIAIAPIGSKHIVEANPERFKYNDKNIKTYGRKSDKLFNKMLDKQSGTIYLVSDLEILSNTKNRGLRSLARYASKSKFEPHLLHNFSNKSLENAKLYKNVYSTSTGQAAPVSNSVKSTSSNPQTVKSEPPKMTSKDFSDMIRQKYKTQQAENNKKFSKIFRTSTPNSGNGHWVTMNGAHVFIEDK